MHREFVTVSRADARPGESGVIEELTYGSRECGGLLIVEIMPTAVELPEKSPFDRFDECTTLRDGNDRVTITPTEGDGRELGDLVSLLEERATLATPVDHVAHRSRERARGPRHGVHRAELPDLLLRKSRAIAMQRDSRSKCNRIPSTVTHECRVSRFKCVEFASIMAQSNPSLVRQRARRRNTSAWYTTTSRTAPTSAVRKSAETSPREM